MTDLSDHPTGDFIKALYIGVPGTGKTGSLVSLVKAGYKLRIIDTENGLDPLVYQIKTQCPELIGNVQYVTCQDRFKMSAAGPRVQGTPKAFVDASKYLDKWTDDTDPASWGSDFILVVDSMTGLAKAAFTWAVAQNPISKDPRPWYGGAQDALDAMIGTITSDTYKVNVIVTSHIDFVDEDGGLRGFPTTIGKALHGKIGRHFNTLIRASSTGAGANVKRKIKTVPDGVVDLKNPAPMLVKVEYPLESGLAEIFKELSSTSK